MYRILIAECKQEISSFNPVICQYDHFAIHSGDSVLEYHTDIESEVCGALEVFRRREDIELVPGYSARASSAGPDMPVVISLDLVGILTRKMLSYCDGLTVYYTHPALTSQTPVPARRTFC